MVQVCDFYMIHMYLWWYLHNMCDRLLILERKKQISFWHVIYGSEQVNATHPPHPPANYLTKENYLYFEEDIFQQNRSRGRKVIKKKLNKK